MIENNYLKKNGILCVVIFIFFISININVPMMGEDFPLQSYGYEHRYQSGENISVNLKNTTYKIINQSQNWNVRLGEQISIIFGNLNHVYFVILNSIVSLLYIVLIQIYASGATINAKEKKFFINTIISFSLVVLFQPALGEIFFWRTGSSNYLWSVFILLTFGLPIRFAFEGNENIFKSKILIFFHTLLGFFAGFTNENTVITFLAIYFFVFILKIYKKEKIHYWMITSFTTLFLGFLYMVMAPSTKIRMNTYNEMFGIESTGILEMLIRTPSVIYRCLNDNFYFIVVFFIVLIIQIYILSKSKQKSDKNRVKFENCRKVLNSNRIFLIFSGLSVAALIASPYIETRAFLLVDFFIIVNILDLYNNIGFLNSRLKNINRFIIPGLIICSFFVCIDINITYRNYHDFFIAREQIIIDSKNSNKEYALIELYKAPISRLLNTREDYLESNMQHLSQYYGIDVKFTKAIPVFLKNKKSSNIEDLSYSLEKFEYNSNEEGSAILSGWAGILNKNSEGNKVFISLESEYGEYIFKTVKVYRDDVSECFENEKFDNTGFYLDVNNLNLILPTGDYEIAITVENSKDKIERKVYTKKHLTII